MNQATIDKGEQGLVVKSDGWFVVKAREMRWVRVGGLGEVLELRRRRDEENFLILSGTATLIIEGHERPLQQRDFVHCPPCAGHTIVALRRLARRAVLGLVAGQKGV